MVSRSESQDHKFPSDLRIHTTAIESFSRAPHCFGSCTDDLAHNRFTVRKIRTACRNLERQAKNFNAGNETGIMADYQKPAISRYSRISRKNRRWNTSLLNRSCWPFPAECPRAASQHADASPTTSAMQLVVILNDHQHFLESFSGKPYRRMMARNSLKRRQRKTKKLSPQTELSKFACPIPAYQADTKPLFTASPTLLPSFKALSTSSQD